MDLLILGLGQVLIGSPIPCTGQQSQRNPVPIPCTRGSEEEEEEVLKSTWTVDLISDLYDKSGINEETQRGSGPIDTSRLFDWPKNARFDLTPSGYHSRPRRRACVWFDWFSLKRNPSAPCGNDLYRPSSGMDGELRLLGGRRRACEQELTSVGTWGEGKSPPSLLCALAYWIMRSEVGPTSSSIAAPLSFFWLANNKMF